MDEAIAAMKVAFAAVSEGTHVMPQRQAVPLQDRGSVSFFMPAAAWRGGTEALGIKVVSVFPENPEKGKATIQGAVLVLDPTTGEILALLEGAALTAIRTGAASGAATDLLARPESKTLAMIGTGGQAPAQVEAVCTARSIETVWLYSLDPDQARSLTERLAGTGPIPSDMRVAASASEAIKDADVINTATIAREPVFADRDVKPGTHINAVGAFTPEMCEIPSESVIRARVVVDQREAAWVEAGDLIQPFDQGLIEKNHVWAELGELVNGARPGRADTDQITMFKSVGVGVQDVIAAHVALRNAETMELGKVVELA
jgi:ornithine cyclodeaminase